MKILVDPQIFKIQKYGGISRYYTEVLSRLKSNNEIIFPIHYVSNIYFNRSNLPTFQQKALYFLFYILAKIRLTRLEYCLNKNNIFLKDISDQKFDVFVATYYDSYFIDLIHSKPFVLTVYDMIHELFPQFFSSDNFVIKNKKFLMEKAARIIAVSENTKKDILKIYPDIDSSKIDVVYHGCSLNTKKLKNIKLPGKYILFVGNRASYKNFTFLLYTIADILRNDNNLFLICAGAGKFNSAEIELISNLKLKSKVLQKNFKESELGVFYQKALFFVFPSIYEGFGLPILESMTFGCPVVLGNLSVFKEVAGDAGIYFDINNSQDFKNKINLLLDNPGFRKEYSLRGLQQVKKYSWEKAAFECLNVYKKVCS
jgi:glycosyltransferase involved in cell wall biosynthesis